MDIQISGHHVEVTPAIREYTEKKLDKLKLHLDDIISIHVVYTIENLQKIAEAQVTVPKQTFHAKAEEENLYGAIDQMTDKLVRQLTKFKEKRSDHH